MTEESWGQIERCWCVAQSPGGAVRK